MNYSLSAPVIVIVIVALAEELLALLTLLLTSLSGTPVSATETTLSPKPSKTNPTRTIARMIAKNGVFTSASAQYNFTLSQP